MSAPPRRHDRLVEYFVQIGLQQPLQPLQRETDKPITDLRVIYHKDPCPAGFEKLEFSVSGGSGNLSAGGNVFSPSVWLCVSRAPRADPITELSILYLDREDGGRLAPGWHLVGDESSKPAATYADLNHGSYGYAVGLAYTRLRTPGRLSGALLDIGILNQGAHDVCPPRYQVVGTPRRSNVNAGSFRDHIVLVARHVVRDPLLVVYKPGLLSRYPSLNHVGSPCPQGVALACAPEGLSVVARLGGPPPASSSSFVLTTDGGGELFAASLTFWEGWDASAAEVDFDEEGSASASASSASAAAASVAVHPASSSASSSSRGRSASSSGGGFGDLVPRVPLYAPRKLVLLSSWPFLANFHAWLEEIYRLSRQTGRTPLERFVTNLFEVPLPAAPGERVRIDLALSPMQLPSSPAGSPGSGLLSSATPVRSILFDRPNADDFPLANFPFTLLFRTLSLPCIILFLSAILQEKKVVMTSRVLPLLTVVGETIRALIFPLKWQNPYIPILPSPHHGMLDAPMPIFVGISEESLSSRPPLVGEDIVVVYLDRDEVRIGGSGREAWSSKSLHHMHEDGVGGEAASAAAASTGGASAGASSAGSAGASAAAAAHSASSTTASASSSSGAAPSASSYTPLPAGVPHLTLLPEKLVSRLHRELMVHSNVGRLRRFASVKEMEAYFKCFRSSTRAEDEELADDSDATAAAASHKPLSRSASAASLSSSASPSAPGLYTPPSSSASNNPNVIGIRACFLHLFVTLLHRLDAHLKRPKGVPSSPSSSAAAAQAPGGEDASHSAAAAATLSPPSPQQPQHLNKDDLFDLKAFLRASESRHRPFLQALTDTQMFSYLLEEKIFRRVGDVRDRDRELDFFKSAQDMGAAVEAARMLRHAQVKDGAIPANAAANAPPGVVQYLSQQSQSTRRPIAFIMPGPDDTGTAGQLFSYAEFPRSFDEKWISSPLRVIEVPPSCRARKSTIATSASMSSSATSSMAVVLTKSAPSGLSASAGNSRAESPVQFAFSSDSTANSSLQVSPAPSAPVTPQGAGSMLSDDSIPATVQRRNSDSVSSSSAAAADSQRPTKSQSVGALNDDATALEAALRTVANRSSSASFASAHHGKSASFGSINGVTAALNRASLAPPPNQNRLFNGSKGPTPALRAGPAAGIPSAIPEKKPDTLTSILNFLTKVPQKAPQPSPARPSANGQRTAPSTPQRAVGGAPIRQPPGSAQRAPGSAVRTMSANSGSFSAMRPGPTASSASVSTPLSTIADSTPRGNGSERRPTVDRAASQPRYSESGPASRGTPMRQPNFDLAGPWAGSAAQQQVQQIAAGRLAAIPDESASATKAASAAPSAEPVRQLSRARPASMPPQQQGESDQQE